MLPSSAEKGSGIRIEYAKNRMGEVSNHHQQQIPLQHPQQSYLANAAAAAAAAASLGANLCASPSTASVGAAEQQMMIDFTASCLSPPPNKMVRAILSSFHTGCPKKSTGHYWDLKYISKKCLSSLKINDVLFLVA